MQAILKSGNKIIINGADSSERILIENLIELSKKSDIKFESVLDINGDATGCMITLTEKVPTEDEEPNETPEENNPDEIPDEEISIN